ncbi:hypothetical protein D3C84_1070070 [compost metagenome]
MPWRVGLHGSGRGEVPALRSGDETAQSEHGGIAADRHLGQFAGLDARGLLTRSGRFGAFIRARLRGLRARWLDPLHEVVGVSHQYRMIIGCCRWR